MTWGQNFGWVAARFRVLGLQKVRQSTKTVVNKKSREALPRFRSLMSNNAFRWEYARRWN